MLLKLAFRNCLRNKRRTVITGLSILVAVLIVLIVMSFMYSCIGDMVDNERRFSLGDVRIRMGKYSEYESLMPLQFYIEDCDGIKDELLAIDGVSGAEALINVYGSLYKDGKLSTVSVIGADPGSVYIGDDVIIKEGRLLEDGTREMMATVRFLDEFSLSVGDQVTVVFRTATGGTNASTFRIVGAIGYNSAEYNSSLAVVSESVLSQILHMNGGALEMHVWLDGAADPDLMAETISKVLMNDDIEVKGWKGISAIYPILPLYDVMIAIVVVLFFFIASTLVFNTMMMSTLERKKEISTMIALGFSRQYVIVLLIIEGMMISLMSSLLAALAGKAIITFFGIHGLDLTPFGADAVEGWGFPNILYTDLASYLYFAVVAIEVAVSALASFIATRRVRKLEVAESLREEA